MLILLIHESVKIPHFYQSESHVFTGSLNLIPDSRIRNIVSKGLKYRFPSNIDFNRCREEFTSAVMILVIDGVTGRVLSERL